MNEAACGRIRIVLAELIKHSTEEYVDSRTAVERKEFARLGLTDAVLLASAHVNVALWTDDHDLYLAALRQKTPFVNFTHLRRSRGLL